MSDSAFNDALTSAKNKAEAKNTTKFIETILNSEYL